MTNLQTATRKLFSAIRGHHVILLVLFVSVFITLTIASVNYFQKADQYRQDKATFDATVETLSANRSSLDVIVATYCSLESRGYGRPLIYHAESAYDYLASQVPYSPAFRNAVEQTC